MVFERYWFTYKWVDSSVNRAILNYILVLKYNINEPYICVDLCRKDYTYEY